MVTDFAARSWAKLPYDAAVRDWAASAWQAGQIAKDAPEHALWWDCENTWFIGVDALPNDAAGAIGAGPALTGAPVESILALYGEVLPLHPGQLSITYPGYPRPRMGESEAGFRYRIKRDAAHLDGLQKGEDGGRYIAEPHAWILGLPLTENVDTEAPLVIWEGSHEIMRTALLDALAAHPQDRWHAVDLQAPYQAARKQVFETCARVKVIAQPGEAILMHRLSVHGVSAWESEPEDLPSRECRAIAYFRPILPGGAVAWLANT
ncbi:hypothetical protein J7399_00390 [Shimia sp. R9_1]|uniref:hypothetical protein n=1 Tax=Shimia sp. R9_1 TaxID=2821111 RepID=UPI001ADBDE59|nr:hypothetical protein [Shimia sp. R9_1]MBO9405868.1 hypothetical protein [Shimia sp. R9_1]